MEILHVTAECYPYAKAGGLGDVAGALPKYQNELGHIAKVVMPMHRTKFLLDNEWDTVHKGAFTMGHYYFDYTIIKERTNKLGFDLYCVDIFGLFNREKVYGYDDDTERYTAFNIAVTDWISKWNHHPDIVHVHDHHAGLVPFMMQNCFAYRHLAPVSTILTIHNAQYQGQFGWDKQHYIPPYDTWQWGKLDWNDSINPLASAVKCALKVTTVSPSYMEDLKFSAAGMEALFEYEKGKCSGILNGIDNEVWDPATDTYILDNFSVKDVDAGKELNKKKLCDDFGLDIKKPLFIFIGRLVGEKAADLLPQAVYDAVYHINGRMNFLFLGSGDPAVEHQLENMRSNLVGFYNAGLLVGWADFPQVQRALDAFVARPAVQRGLQIPA